MQQVEENSNSAVAVAESPSLMRLLQSESVRHFIKFGIVGAFTWLVDFATLALLQQTLLVPEAPHLRLKVITATAIAFFIGVTVNFLLHRYWTFKGASEGVLGQQLFRYSVVVGLAVVFRLIFVLLTFRLIGNAAADVLASLSLIDNPAALWVNQLTVTTNLNLISDFSVVTINQLGSSIAQVSSIPMIILWNFFGHKYWTYRK